MNIQADVLYPAVDEIASRLPKAKLDKSPDTALYPGGLDSINLVAFVNIVEEKLEERTGKPVRLVTDRAMSQKTSPFRTLGSLADYIGRLLKDDAA